MIIDGMDFYNIEHYEVTEFDDMRLSRLNLETISRLNDRAKFTAFNTCGVELRFFMKSDEVKLFFSRNDTPENVSSFGICSLYQGEQQLSYELNPQIIGENTVITIKKEYLYKNCLEEKSRSFHPELIRVILPYDWNHVYQGMIGEVRTPSNDDYPIKRFLSYGSSITHGGSSSMTTNSYVFSLSQHLGYDYQNWGLAGSCFLDEVMAERIQKEKWDFLILELGVNVLDWSNDYFEEQVEMFFKTVSKSENLGSVYCIGLFRKESDIQKNEKNIIYREIIQKIAKKYEQFVYLDGYELLSSWRGLSIDGLHPSDYGMATIANNIYKKIREKEEV